MHACSVTHHQMTHPHACNKKSTCYPYSSCVRARICHSARAHTQHITNLVARGLQVAAKNLDAERNVIPIARRKPCSGLRGIYNHRQLLLPQALLRISIRKEARRW
jgi:hypothetical protein